MRAFLLPPRLGRRHRSSFVPRQRLSLRQRRVFPRSWRNPRPSFGPSFRQRPEPADRLRGQSCAPRPPEPHSAPHAAPRPSVSPPTRPTIPYSDARPILSFRRAVSTPPPLFVVPAFFPA